MWRWFLKILRPHALVHILLAFEALPREDWQIGELVLSLSLSPPERNRCRPLPRPPSLARSAQPRSRNGKAIGRSPCETPPPPFRSPSLFPAAMAVFSPFLGCIHACAQGLCSIMQHSISAVRWQLTLPILHLHLQSKCKLDKWEPK